jgi:5-formyltetrahydrofolate cyclo-ligase
MTPRGRSGRITSSLEKGELMTKEELRELYRKKRRSLDPEDLDEGSRAIADRFMGLIDRKEHSHVETVHSFLPIEKNREVDTWPIIRTLRQREGARVVVSRTDFGSGTMEHYLLQEESVIAVNSYGIPEPQGGTPVPVQEIDLVLMPLLAYDEQGDRVGYGAGYYDRFLEACRDDVIKVGLSFFQPVDRIEDVGDHDIVLDHCITPERVHSFPA